jgi:hypothetical protein
VGDVRDPIAEFAANIGAASSLLAHAVDHVGRGETARPERGERGPLRRPDTHGIRAEFSDDAFGVAAEVAVLVSRALVTARAKSHGKKLRWTADKPWTVAARLLRAGWKRGESLQPHIISEVKS